MFTIGETRPNCDANEPQVEAQGRRQTRRGRLNNETSEQCERRLQIQREQRQRQQEETEEQRKCKSEYHRKYNQDKSQLDTQP